MSITSETVKDEGRKLIQYLKDSNIFGKVPPYYQIAIVDTPKSKDFEDAGTIDNFVGCCFVWNTSAGPKSYFNPPFQLNFRIFILNFIDSLQRPLQLLVVEHGGADISDAMLQLTVVEREIRF